MGKCSVFASVKCSQSRNNISYDMSKAAVSKQDYIVTRKSRVQTDNTSTYFTLLHFSFVPL
jgi:hypothetical protein